MMIKYTSYAKMYEYYKSYMCIHTYVHVLFAYIQI